MSSYQFEIALRKFIAAFDGTNSISQADFQSRFDNLYHKNYTFKPKSENVRGEDGLLTTKKQAPLSREEVFEVWSNKLASGTKMTLMHIRKIGLDCIDVKVRQVTGQEENTFRVISTLSDSQIEEHTSELQSHHDLVCRLLLEKKKGTRILFVGYLTSS